MGLVDGDAYGLDILSVYRYGSQSLRHENEKLAAHRIQWLGVRTSDLAGYGASWSMTPFLKQSSSQPGYSPGYADSYHETRRKESKSRRAYSLLS